MRIFKPNFRFEKVTDIDMSIFVNLGIKAVFLDVDNTLCSYKSKTPLKGAIEWVRNIENHGLKVYIVSNNFEDRVSSVAKKYGLPHVSLALKPLPRGFNKASKILGFSKKECVIVGDQIFTDILGANFAGMKSILVEPVEPEDLGFITIRRVAEVPIKKHLQMTKKGE